MNKYDMRNVQIIDNLLENLINEDVLSVIKKSVLAINDKIVESLIGKGKKNYFLLISTRNSIFLLFFNQFEKDSLTVQQRQKADVREVKFLRGAPNGKFSIIFANDQWKFNHIFRGRVFDFLQDVKPRDINNAGYDYTIRGEFHQLLDPDHAEEIDRLRKYMQDGHISHYEYDDYNPSISKAGK